MKSVVTGRGALALAVVVVLLAFFATVAPASAARLTVASKARAYAMTTPRCTNGPLTVVPTGTANAQGQFTSVRVTGITGTACTTGRVIMYRSTAPATILFGATGTVSAGALTATSTAFTPPASAGGSVFVTLNGWAVPATWAYTPPPPPLLSCITPDDLSVGCTATVSSGTAWGTPLSDYLGTVTISTTSRTAVRWQLTINLSDTTTIPFVTKSLKDGQGGLVLIGTSGCSANPRTVTVQGTPAWNPYQTVVAGRSPQMELHGYSTPQSGATLINCP
ncbi:hypothetical protein [Cellulomonas sp.]|uniref:hypothetical protein n=1 Tax=Cellulomonas sp. TaxID=40001 RepID=UPI003BAA1274